MVFPHVDQAVSFRFQAEMLAMREHADVAPALLSCLESAQCFVNNTACVDACFQSLPISNCDTTPQRALAAHDALNQAGVVGFTRPLQNLLLRDIQERTGFLVKDPSPRCVRMKQIEDAVTCPGGHFVRSSAEIVQRCNVSGYTCYDRDCICNPCRKAFEVEFFASTDSQQQQNNGSIGSGCAKFSICGAVEQEHLLSFRAFDNLGRPNATMTGAILRTDESEEPFRFENINGSFYYDYLATQKRVGQHVIKIRINGEEIPESPFRIHVLERDCTSDTGELRREPDDLGQCICQRGTVEISAKCVPWTVIFFPSALGLLFLLLSLLWWVRHSHKQDNEDSLWIVKKEEVTFDKPPKVLGQGAFGVVLLA